MQVSGASAASTVAAVAAPVAEGDILDLDLSDFDPLQSGQELIDIEALPGALELEAVVSGPGDSGPGDSGLYISNDDALDASSLELDMGDQLEHGVDGPAAPIAGLGTADGGLENEYLDTNTLVIGTEAEPLDDIDEMQTRLELAEQYISMGENAAAEEIIDEVLADGSDVHKTAAAVLQQRLSEEPPTR
ncbi:MAG: hypothetical protein GKR94_23255 [Gammaproteobacteria bacterium]|nr:hypothetical protein [Gammaproteobacteria bacterium]